MNTSSIREWFARGCRVSGSSVWAAPWSWAMMLFQAVETVFQSTPFLPCRSSSRNRKSSPNRWKIRWWILLEQVASWWAAAVRIVYTRRCVLPLHTCNTCPALYPYPPRHTMQQKCRWVIVNLGRCLKQRRRHQQTGARSIRLSSRPAPRCTRASPVSFLAGCAWECWSTGWTTMENRDHLATLPCSLPDSMSNPCSLRFWYVSRYRWRRTDLWIWKADDDIPWRSGSDCDAPHRTHFEGQVML